MLSGLPLLKRPDVGFDLLKCPQRLWLVEVPRERDFIADDRLGRIDPGVGRMRQNLATEERLDTAVF